MNLADTLEYWVSQTPEANALISANAAQSLNFSQLGQRVDSFAAYLQQRGIQKGSKVLILKGMSAELYISLIALFKIGAVAIFVDPGQRYSYIVKCIKKSKPDAILSTKKMAWLSYLIPIRWTIRKNLTTNNCWSGVNSIHSLSCDLHENSPALITFTSGSTGSPKVIVRSHKFLLHQLDGLIPHLKLERQDQDLCTMPVFVLANLASGISTHLPNTSVSKPGSVNVPILIKQINSGQISRIGGSPALFASLCRASADTHSLTKLYTGGAPVLPTLLDEMQQWAPTADIVAIYGSSEAEPIARLPLVDITNSDRIHMRMGTGLLVGLPVTELQVAILNSQADEDLFSLNVQQWTQRQCAVGDIGEIVVTGPHVLPGYLNGDGDWENKIDFDGQRWHRTGDTGYFDSSGRLWLTGRLKAKIDDEAGGIYPFSVEVAAAMIEPKVNLSALVLINNKRILMVENLAEEECINLKNKLSFAHIAKVISVQKLPVDRRHNAKIDYSKLNQLINKHLNHI